MASGTIQLKASFDNADNALWPGLSVTHAAAGIDGHDVVVVADNAVQRGPNGLYVYVVTPDSQGRAAQRHGRAASTDGQALVEKGLSPGERVVTSGHYRVQPGGPVQVR